MSSEGMEKYVEKALEGYEQNFEGITKAIDQMEQQLEAYKTQRSEMSDGITEMKGLLGLTDELTEEEAFPPLQTVEDIDE